MQPVGSSRQRQLLRAVSNFAFNWLAQLVRRGGRLGCGRGYLYSDPIERTAAVPSWQYSAFDFRLSRSHFALGATNHSGQPVNRDGAGWQAFKPIP